MATAAVSLTASDLAKLARELPYKVLRELGNLLQQTRYNCGNWETVGEDLGFTHAEIQQFVTQASVRRESTPGELMLRDWAERGDGRTLFVLRNALVTADRQDCVQFMEHEIYSSVVCIRLMFCVRDEVSGQIEHGQVRVRGESSLRDSLTTTLNCPLQEQYQLLDTGVSWDGTQARELKGRQLMLLKLSSASPMEQDPTIDSSVSLEATRKINERHNRSCQSAPRNRNYSVDRTFEPFTNMTGMVDSEQKTQPSCTNNSEIAGQLAHGKSWVRSAEVCNRQSSSGSSTAATFNSRLSDRQVLTDSGSVLISSSTQESSPSYSKCFMYSAYPKVISESTNNLNICEESQSPIGPLNITFESTSEQRNLYKDKMLLPCSNDSQPQKCISNAGASLSSVASSVSNNNDNSVDQGPSSQTELMKLERKAMNIDCIERMKRCTGDDDVDDETRQCSSIDDSANYRDPTGCTVDDVNNPDNWQQDVDSITELKQAASGHKNGNTPFNVTAPSQVTDKDSEHVTIDTIVKRPTDDSITFVKQSAQQVDSITRLKQTWFSDDAAMMVDCTLANDTTSVVTEQDINGEETQTENITTCAIENVTYRADRSLTFIKPVFSNVQDTGKSDIETVVCESIDEEMEESSAYCGDTDRDMNDYQYHAGFMDTGFDPSTPRAYFDFNNYPQTSNDASGDVSEDSANHSSSASVCSDSKLTHSSRVPKRCISELSPRPVKPESYEKLDRVLSCPSDSSYEGRAEANLTPNDAKMDLPTIADVFSPVKEEFKLADFEKKLESAPQLLNTSDEMETSGQSGSTSSSGGSGSSGSSSDCRGFRREPYRITRASQTNERTNFRHSAPARHIEPHVSFQLSPENDESQLHETRCYSSTTMTIATKRRGNCLNDYKPALPPRCSGISNPMSSSTFSRTAPRAVPGDHGFMTVTAGTSRRPSLDSMLVNDKLFVHYSKILQGYPGWCPRETEYTIEKTMLPTLSTDGYFILWYSRTKKNLAIGISYCGTLMHYRVHTKVIEGHLHYYITDMLFHDVISLLQYYMSHGLRLHCHHSNTGSRGESGKVVNMRSPVLVQYDGRSAIDV